MKKNILLTLSLLVTAAGGVNAQTAVTVFSNPPSGATATRIPAITRDKSGNLVAFADKRYGIYDIGGGNSIDIVAKTSSDNGATWGIQSPAITHDENVTSGFDFAHGDAAVVTDRESGEMLLMCASGSTGYSGTGIKVGRYYSSDNGKTWGLNSSWTTQSNDVTDDMYAIWGSKVTRMFFGSGRICQSRFIKTGNYYRLYAALTTNLGSLVVYSDDFGNTWNALGGTSTRPASSGDEAKCEELPNGNVLLSSRMDGGRYFNIFTYTNKKTAAGNWGTAVASTSTGGTVATSNTTNGEILIIPATRNSDGKELYVALQSVPFGSGRNNVGIYYKELASRADFDQPSCFQTGWNKYQVSKTTSAYSTMALDQNGNIAFLYEENLYNSGYDIQFKSLPLSTITGNEYAYKASIDNETFLNPLAGKIYTFKCQGTDGSGNAFSYYLYDNVNSSTKLGVTKASEVGTSPTDYKYYWVVSRDPDGKYYYISAFQGDGYLGMGEGVDYSDQTKTGTIPVCTDDYTKEFPIVGFAKQGSSTQGKTGQVMDGLALEFYDDRTGQLKDKWVAIATDGEINWFDHTTKSEYISSTSRYWTTDFIITEVGYTSTIGNYGTFAAPKQFGFPVKMTRSDDSYTAISSVEDYDYYATLKLPFATTLPAGVKAYKITSLEKPNNSQVVLTEYLNGDNGDVLPRETPVLLTLKGAKGDGVVNAQQTKYFSMTFAKAIETTGFNGTLGAKTFATTVYDYTTNPNYYVLGKEKGRVAFYYLTSQTIGANKAYYIYTGTAAPAKSLSFAFTDDDATTAIELPNTTTTTDANAPIYDLSGRRVTSPTKGIYIQGGKKFVVK
jgi:sialidase-1